MAATYESIATTTLGSATTTITFSSIPATYTDLKVVFVGTAATPNGLVAQFNSDTGTNYSVTNLEGSGTAATSSRTTSSSTLLLGFNNGLSTTIPSLWTMDIFSYAGSTYKTCLTTSSTDFNGSGYVERNVGLWRSTSAITSISLFLTPSANLSIGTIATLYGIKAA